ncbi:hypothetical protein FS749_012977 [Ceratobasidium sp. UAMH 11750]|nr:hypothetical protein FS749_012977 [Ceratobasidium sp. UAMH 11750]
MPPSQAPSQSSMHFSELSISDGRNHGDSAQVAHADSPQNGIRTQHGAKSPAQLIAQAKLELEKVLQKCRHLEAVNARLIKEHEDITRDIAMILRLEELVREEYVQLGGDLGALAKKQLAD